MFYAIGPDSRLSRLLGLLVVALVLVGCAGSGETTTVPAAVGVWEYEAESQQETYRGTLTITQSSEGTLTGDISPNDQSVGPLEVQNVTYQDSTLTFDIEGGQGGPMDATVDVVDGRFEGEITVSNYGMTMSFSATKQSE